jgi:hypothetical protein
MSKHLIQMQLLDKDVRLVPVPGNTSDQQSRWRAPNPEDAQGHAHGQVTPDEGFRSVDGKGPAPERPDEEAAPGAAYMAGSMYDLV